MAYAEVPYRDAIAVPENPLHPLASKLPKLKLGDKFLRWFSGLSAEVDLRPKRNAQVNLQGQGASIATTPIPIGTVTQGLWRISTSLRVTTVAGVSSAIQLTLAWTDRAIAQTKAGTNLNGNLTTTREDTTTIVRVDSATPISYSTTYASNAAGVMKYSLDIVAELLAADV